MKRPLIHVALIIFLGFPTLLVSGCHNAVISGTQIADTDDNRAIHRVVMAYRRALEDRDPDALLPLISRKYFENNATTDRNSDDYGYARLREQVLPLLQENVKAVQMRIIMTDIEVQGDAASASFEYFYQFKFVEGGKEGWEQKNDFNRLDLVKEAGAWRIAGGL